MSQHTAFVQVGATRDGLEPYLDCARARRLPAVLVETPAYLAWRAMLGRRAYDIEIPVADPQHPDAVTAALRAAGISPALVLTGFERYVGSAFALARELRVPPWPRCGALFLPVDKQGQRAMLAARAPHLPQPRYVTAPLGHADSPWRRLRFPQVVKPTDGGGGLGITLVGDARQRERALARLRVATNYGGGRFASVIVEEFVTGQEWSAQGIVVAGRPVLLAACEKIVTLEPAPGDATAHGFRETGHIVHRAQAIPLPLRALATAAIGAFGLDEGPFHVDAILTDDAAHFIEAGFRLSGSGIVALIRRATGIDWAERVFGTHLGETPPGAADGTDTGTGPVTGTGVTIGTGVTVGQIIAASPAELDVARALAGTGVDVEIQEFSSPPDPAGTGVETASLSSDLARHTGFAGRVIISGADPDQVRSALQRCVGARSEVMLCAD